uniref:Uncharacterized protein n=1 Tax=Cyprinus carpio TaxID=7962 RepID=A0A8C2JXK2_CYPCA
QNQIFVSYGWRNDLCHNRKVTQEALSQLVTIRFLSLSLSLSLLYDRFAVIFCSQAFCVALSFHESYFLVKMSGTMLTSLPQDLFQNLKALSTLTRNLLTSLPEDAFQGLEKLGQLMLQRNAIRKLYSSTFRGLSHLKSLFLQQNNLTDIPAGIFDDLVNLEVLHLQDNKITQLPANLFSNLPMLKKLYLSNNRLSLLPGAIFLNLPNLTHISLYENQLSRLMPGTFGPMNITSLMCYAPPALNGRNIRELKEDDIMVSQTAAETTVDISPESTQAYSEPTERHLPHTSPTKPSDSTTVSKEIEDTSGGNAVGQGLSKDKLIIILAIVCTAVIVGIITCVCYMIYFGTLVPFQSIFSACVFSISTTQLHLLCIYSNQCV